ncbi:MAG: SurA N-terminal domain-containing protein [Christensenellales bacterium]|jgi:hypothetical protein
MNKFTKILCILLGTLMLSACSGTNKKPDSVVAVINGTELTLGEFEAQYNNVKEFYLYNDGTDLDAEENAGMNAELRMRFLNSIIEKTVLRQEIEEMGLDQFTPQEEENILLAAQQEYEGQKAIFIEYMTGMSEQEIEAALPQLMAENGVTIDGIVNRFKLNVMEARHRDKITENVQVTEQDVRWEYEDYESSFKEDMDSMPSFFPNAWNNDLLIMAIAQDLSIYEWILVPLDSEIEAELNQLQYEQDQAYEQKRGEYLLQIEQGAQAVLERVLDGEDFKAVQKEIGNGGYYDVENPPQGLGYCISEYSEEIYPQLKEAALSLTGDGQIATELVGANDGYYILKRIRSIEAEDIIPEEEALKILESSALEKNRETIYEFYMMAITSGKEITIFEDVLN